MLKKIVIAPLLLFLTLMVGVLALVAIPDPNMKTFEEPPDQINILWLRFDDKCLQDKENPWREETICRLGGNQQCTVHTCD